MKFEEFEIGKNFFASAGFEWFCTDKGTRTVVAIRLDPEKDISWFKGPPYALVEEVFDESDFASCHRSQEELILNRIKTKSVHPGFELEDFLKMAEEWQSEDTGYLKDKIFKHDRISSDGKVLHPYGKEIKNGKNYIKVFEIFSHEYSIIDENELILLPYSSEEAMINRINSLNND